MTALELTQRSLERIGLPIVFDLMGRIHDEKGDRVDNARVLLRVDPDLRGCWAELGHFAPRTIHFSPILPTESIETRFPQFGPIPDLNTAVRIILLHELAHWRLAHNGLAAGIDRKDTSTWEADADALALDWFRSGFPEAVGPKGRPVTPTGYLAAGQWIFVHGYVCGPFRLKAEAARNPEDIYHLDRESVSDDIGCSPEDALRYGDAETFEELGALLHFYEIASDREAARFAMTRLRLAQKAVAGEKDPVRIKGLCAVLERWAMRAAGKCRPKDRAGIVSSSSGVTR